MHPNSLADLINTRFSAWINKAEVALGEVTLEVKRAYLLEMCRALRDESDLAFNQLIDVCGVDYLQYGLDDWQTKMATETGFSRGVTEQWQAPSYAGETATTDAVTQTARFAVVYHLLSLTHNHRVRLRVFLPDHAELLVDSVMSLWPAANWYEREVFDLFGILFKGHPDLRRILTDYGFVGHPFRKDFPLIGKVEARYDAKLKRVVYEPVSIQPRVLEPKVIRRDNRYLGPKEQDHDQPGT